MVFMSHEQLVKYVAYMPCAVAPLSIVGSFLTILTIFRTTYGGAPLVTYHRLLLGVSTMDMILSIALTAGPLPLPRELEYDLPGVRTYGNRSTCRTQAFLLQLGSCSFLYNTMLMLYFVLVVRYGLREKFISTRVEPFMHFLANGYYLGTAITGLALDVFNPAGTFCWVAGVPLGCEFSADEDCERGGDHVRLFGQWLLVVPLVALTCLLVIFISILAGTVWWRYRQSRRFVFENALGYGGVNDTIER